MKKMIVLLAVVVILMAAFAWAADDKTPAKTDAAVTDKVEDKKIETPPGEKMRGYYDSPKDKKFLEREKQLMNPNWMPRSSGPVTVVPDNLQGDVDLVNILSSRALFKAMTVHPTHRVQSQFRWAH